MYQTFTQNFILPPLSKEALDKLPFGVYIINKDGIVEFFNSEMTKISGVKEAKEIEGQNVLKVPTYKKYGLDKYIKQGLAGIPFKIEGIKYISYVGKRKSYRSYYGIPVKNEKGKVEKLFCITEDITEKIELEKQIKASLEEKEYLIREVNHRVKNNMQVIYSLLNLQSLNIRDKEALRLIKESKYQIKSMLLIHEKLYQSKNLSKINFKEYLEELVNNLFCVFCLGNTSITKKIEVDNISLSVDKAIPCGLIINELVTNSLKYAFPSKKKGEIYVKFCNLNKTMYELIVGDNGIGFSNKPEKKDKKTLGLILVDTLAKQIYGSVKITNRKGTIFRITFPKYL